MASMAASHATSASSQKPPPNVVRLVADRRFRQASRVGAGEPREAEQQQCRCDGDRHVRAPALRQEYAEHEDCRRQQEHVAQRVGDLCERNRGPAHQSVGGDGQERKAPRGERAADHEHE